VAIVLGSILLVCIALCAVGAVVNAITGPRGSSSTFTFNYSTPTPTDTPWTFTYETPTPSGGGFGGGFPPTATAAPVQVPPVPANCCYNMTLGHSWGSSGNQLYINGRTNNFYAGDTFAYLVNLNGHTLVANNKPAGSTHFWFYLLRPNGNGGEVVVNKFTQDLTGANASADTEAANSFSMINLMQQEPAGQSKAEFVTGDGTTYLGAAIFDYFG
jgi:hypothetical protein